MNKKRILSLLLSLTVLLSTAPMSISAADTEVVQNVELTTEPSDAPQTSDTPATEPPSTDAPATAEPNPSYAPTMSDADALAIVYKEFSGKNIKNPLEFPLEYNGTTYTNVLEYLKAWTFNETGKELSVKFDYVNGASSYTDWSEGYANKITLCAFDENGDIITDYFKDNEPASQRLSNVYFTIGGETSDKIASIYVKSASKVRSAAEIVEYIAKNLPFEFIKGKNTSESEIVSPVGETSASGTVGALPAASANMLYSKAKVLIDWSLENTSGKADALSVSKNKTSVIRPNVYEDNAEFVLTAKVTSVEDETVSAEVKYNLTVPAFKETVVPVLVSKDASFALKDGYYNSDVDGKYIVKQENAPEGYDLYNCILHTSATGTAQKFTYTASKENCISKSGTINVNPDNNDTVTVDLAESSDKDYKLGSLKIVSPTVDDFGFSPDTTEYEIELKGAQTVKIAGATAVDGASAKITSYYKTLANANKGTLTTTGANLTSSGVSCYLPDKISESEIKITVTAPESSIQTTKECVYTIKIKKTAESGPLTKLALTASSSGKGTKCNISAEDITEEEKLSPEFVSGGNEDAYYYTVNYFRDLVKITPTAAGSTITVNGTAVTSGKASDNIPLEVGDNNIVVSVTKNGVTSEYKITVHRKAEFYITNVNVNEGNSASLKDDGSDWTGLCSFENSAETIHVTYHTNTEENAFVRIDLDGTSYTAPVGEAIEIPVKGKDKIMPVTYIIHTVSGVTEAQRYIVSFNRMRADSPDSAESYLPAPGQFVNTDAYRYPERTLTGSAIITLGAFGGSVIYKYDEPIKNNPNNPYGIDFIVMGNCFTNSDGTTSSGAAEPAAVMVSQDGINWYELAGSEYYTAAARHNLTVTYKNGDTSFTAAADTAWTDSDGESGVLPVNAYHNQPYYPNPVLYNVYNAGAGKNDTFTAESVSFTGTMIDAGFYPFGYADSHSEVIAKKNSAVNPYVKNHEAVYNGDGFDIAWAADADGNPVQLDEISYIKIYNPTLSYSEGTGEKSPEIKTVLRAKSSDTAVGKSRGLSALTVNGEAVSLEDGKLAYSIDGKGASSLAITPTAENASANIYVSNKRTESGNTSSITATDKVRIIVQEDEKEPVIYMLSFTNIETAEYNADLTSLTLTPGDEKATDKFAFSVENGVSAVRFTPEFANKKAMAVLSDEKNSTTQLSHGVLCNPIALSVGENNFTLTVTSQNGKNTKTYPVTVTRAASGSSSSQNTISVKFSLIGRTNDKHSGKTWISQKSVTIPKGSTVKYLTEMMLNNAGIDYVTNGVYISEIDGLGEFDEGPNSGWMYRHNGLIADEGYADRKLSSGDAVKWFYTEDYTKETGYESDWDKVNNSSSGTVTKKDNTDKPDDDKSDSNKPSDNTKTLPFDDVSGHWAYDAIKYVYDNSVMQGVSDTEFAPDENMTRAMLVTVLYRLENAENTSYKSKFTDVPDGEWYTDAVNYAAANGIVTGISDTEFAPNANVTREQTAAILYRYAKMKGYDVSGAAELSAFSDADTISNWALDSFRWANKAELIGGVSETELSPKANTTRAQLAAILMRFLEMK